VDWLSLGRMLHCLTALQRFTEFACTYALRKSLTGALFDQTLLEAAASLK
jgi:hypothetical protein